MLKIKLIKSRIGALPKQRQVLDALGLNRINKVKEFNSHPKKITTQAINFIKRKFK